jgi:hypothetical protein
LVFRQCEFNLAEQILDVLGTQVFRDIPVGALPVESLSIAELKLNAICSCLFCCIYQTLGCLDVALVVVANFGDHKHVGAADDKLPDLKGDVVALG